MTLTEFLTARLVQEEVTARYNPAVLEPPGRVLTTTGESLRLRAARVLREVDAKRAIAVRHSPVDEEVAAWTPDRCSLCDEDEGCPDIRSLAGVYSDHPDYDESWRP